MKKVRKELRAVRKELREARRHIRAVESEVRRLRGDKLDHIITSMQQSAREMLRLSRDL